MISLVGWQKLVKTCFFFMGTQHLSQSFAVPLDTEHACQAVVHASQMRASLRAFKAQHRAQAACTAASIFSIPAYSHLDLQFVSVIDHFRSSSGVVCIIMYSLVGHLVD